MFVCTVHSNIIIQYNYIYIIIIIQYNFMFVYTVHCNIIIIIQYNFYVCLHRALQYNYTV
jgi:hypothetical protein